MPLIWSLLSYAPAVIGPRLLALAQITLLTRLIPAGEVGRFVLVMTIGDAIDLFCSNWVRIALARFGSGQPEKIPQETTRSLVFYAATLLVAAPAAIAAAWLLRPEEFWVFLGCVASYTLANGLARIAITVLALRGLRRQFLAVELLRASAVFATVIGLAFSLTQSWIWLTLAANAATFAAAAIGAVFALRGNGLVWPRWAGTGAILHYSLPLIGGAGLTTLLNSADRILLDRLRGPADLALYAAAIVLARQPLEFLFAIVNVRAFPEMMEAYERGGPAQGASKLSDLFCAMLLVALPSAAGLALVAGPLASLLLPPAYVETARIIIPLGALAGLLAGLKFFVFDQAFHMAKAGWQSALTTVPPVALGLALVAWGAQSIGPAGVAAAVAVQFALALAISIIFTHRLLPFVWPWAELGKIAAMTGLMAFGAAGALALLAAHGALAQLTGAVAAGVVAYAAGGMWLRPAPVREVLAYARPARG